MPTIYFQERGGRVRRDGDPTKDIMSKGSTSSSNVDDMDAPVFTVDRFLKGESKSIATMPMLKI
jgi:hypothetical protein